MESSSKKIDKPVNAVLELKKCFSLIETIEDELLREVARVIFAPLGTIVPKPSDHAESFFSLPKEVHQELYKRGGLAAAFRQNKQAYEVLLSAVNMIHELYRANELKFADSIFDQANFSSTSLYSALKAIDSRQFGPRKR